MPVGDQHDGAVAMAVAIGPGGFDEAVDFGVGQVFTRPHLAIVYPFGWSAVGPTVPITVAGVTSARCDFAINFRAFFFQLSLKWLLLGQPTRPGKSINIERNAPRRSHSSPSGSFVATIGFSIGLDADIFRDVAGAEVSGGSRLRAHLSQIGATGTPHRRPRARGRRLCRQPALSSLPFWATHWRRRLSW